MTALQGPQLPEDCITGTSMATCHTSLLVAMPQDTQTPPERQLMALPHVPAAGCLAEAPPGPHVAQDPGHHWGPTSGGQSEEEGPEGTGRGQREGTGPQPSVPTQSERWLTHKRQGEGAGS